MPRRLPSPVALLACALIGFGAGYAVFFQRSEMSAMSASHPATRERGTAESHPALGSARERIAVFLAACEELDPLRRDHAFWLILQQMQPGDFLAATLDLPALVRRGERLPGETGEALIEAALERWLDLEPENALRWLAGSQKVLAMFSREDLADDTGTLRTVFGVLARRQPEWMRAHLDVLEKAPRRAVAVDTLLATITERDPAQARRLFAQFASGPDRAAALRGLARGLAGSDPAAAFDLALSVDDARERERAIWEVITPAAERSPATIREQLARIEEPALRSRAEIQALRAVIASGGGIPFDWLTEIVLSPSRNEGADHFTAVIANLAMHDAEAGLRWAVEDLPPAARPKAVRTLFEFWNFHDPLSLFESLGRQSPQTIALLGSDAGNVLAGGFTLGAEETQRALAVLPAGELRDGVQRGAAVNLAREGRLAEALARFDLAGGHDPKGDFARALAGAYADHDAPAAAAWAAGLPPGRARERAIEAATSSWTHRQPGAAAAWIEQLSPGAGRDRATGAYAQAVAQLDPPAAARTVEGITDPAVRQSAAAEVFKTWAQQDAFASRVWLRGLAGVDDAWREQLVRRSR